MSIQQRDKKHLWHPLTQHKSHPNNIAITKAKDSVLIDENGNTYIDAIASWYTCMYGHCNSYITNKISQQLQQLQYQNQTLQQQSEQARVSQKRFELQSAISRPEVTTTAQQFDARNGAGAFEREVINQGVLAFHTQGIELTTEQAVSKVLGLIGAYSTPADPAVVTTPTTQMPDPANVQKPVIPNVQSQGASPVRQAPNSLDDLRKISDGMSNQA